MLLDIPKLLLTMINMFLTSIISTKAIQHTNNAHPLLFAQPLAHRVQGGDEHKRSQGSYISVNIHEISKPPQELCKLLEYYLLL